MIGNTQKGLWDEFWLEEFIILAAVLPFLCHSVWFLNGSIN